MKISYVPGKMGSKLNEVLQATNFTDYYKFDFKKSQKN